MDYSIQTQTVKPQPYVYLEGSEQPENLPELMGQLLKKVIEKVKASEVKVMPQPVTQYLEQQGETVTMRCGFRLIDDVDIDGLKKDILPGGSVVVTEHLEAYDALHKAHSAILTYIKSNDLVRNGEPWEIYYSDPSASEDPTVGRTVVVFPVE